MARPSAALALAAALLLGGTWTVLTRGDNLLFEAALRDADVAVPALDAEPVAGPIMYLLVGSDRRDPVDPDWDVEGERADSVVLWAIPRTGRVAGLSLPRDLRVSVPGHGDGKLGGALEYGPDALISAVRSLTGLPVHHYVEVGFDAVTAMVDVLGGVPLTVTHAVRDQRTGLALRPGTQELDGAAALAYLRSRSLEELTPAGWTPETSGDLGRIARQQRLLTALAAALPDRCPSWDCLRGLVRARGSLTVDARLEGSDLERLALAFAAPGGPELATLPTLREPPTDAVSPFPPGHLGTVGYRVPDQPAAGTALRRLTATGVPEDGP
ncbi:LCP family protein [Geodermatophilus sp. URMC 60]